MNRTPSPLRIAVDALPAVPGKSGAVGAFRAMLQIAPSIDEGVKLLYFVSSVQREYYQRFLDPKYSDRIQFVVLDSARAGIIGRLMAQHFAVPIYCQRLAASIHFSFNPEPLIAIRGVKEVFKIVDLQFYDVPDEFGLLKSNYRKVLGARKAQRADLIIANSRYTERRILECFDVSPEKIRIVYEAVDHDVFRPNQDLSASRQRLLDKFDIRGPFVVNVSSFRPYKNHMHLLNSFRVLVSDYKVPHQLVLVGNDIRGYRQKVEDQAYALGLKDRVKFVDYVHHWDLPLFYRAASLAVYLSQYETFGIPPLEAMACGVPVIASDSSAIPEVSGGGALIVDPHNTDLLASLIFKVLTEENFARELTKRGLKWCQKYTWRRNIEETVWLFRQLTA